MTVYGYEIYENTEQSICINQTAFSEMGQDDRYIVLHPDQVDMFCEHLKKAKKEMLETKAVNNG